MGNGIAYLDLVLICIYCSMRLSGGSFASYLY